MIIHQAFENLKISLVTEIETNLIETEAPNIDNLSRVIVDANIDFITFPFYGFVIVTILFSFLIGYISFRSAKIALDKQKLFIANLAHELRTPLSLIKTTTEVALIADDMSPEIEDVLQHNVEEIDRISNILHNVLTLNSFYRADAMKFKKVYLHKVAKRAVQSLKDLSQSRNVHVLLTANKELTVWGNETALEQLVTNLVKNAITYSPVDQNSPVHVSICSDQRQHVNLIVKDKGIGIEKKEVFHIMEPFYRINKARTHDDNTSFGLGLTIVSEIAKLHRATVFIKSIVNEGTSIRVRFPESSHWMAHSEPDSDEDDTVQKDFAKNKDRQISKTV